ncbi:MAG: hypothetical protein WAU70_06895 [Flavobacteriales bacterium]
MKSTSAITTLLVLTCLFTACGKQSQSTSVEYKALTLEQMDDMMTKADTVIDLGKAVVEEMDVPDSAGAMMVHVTRTTQEFQIVMPGDMAIGRQSRPGETSSSTITIGGITCTMTCDSKNNGERCEIIGCSPIGSKKGCSTGSCSGGCSTVSCIRTGRGTQVTTVIL